MVTLNVNGRKIDLDVPADMPLLWALRDHLGLTGAKYGCGMALCGACTVHLNGEAVRSCQTPVSQVVGQKITTIEGIRTKAADAVMGAWEKLNVPQCGFCQPGQVMAASALLAINPHPSDADIDAWLTGNLCRCGTYQRIRAAIHEAAKQLG